MKFENKQNVIKRKKTAAYLNEKSNENREK